MKAITGKLLSVDLNEGTCAAESLPQKMYREYLGGYGLGAALLLQRMDPACDPLGPGNILGFAAGYLTGTGAYIASRFMVFGKSPSTHGWGDANCGGHFGRKLKESGFDAILFLGRSKGPVYLLVDQGQATLEKADWLWGQDTYRSEDELKKRHGADCQVACIGPAGERLSGIAGISTDKGRFAARSALGAVMGSKKLKAVVVKGSLPIVLADEQKMRELRKQHLAAFKGEFGATLAKYGTPMFYESCLKVGDTPIRNWSESIEALPANKLTADKVLEYQLKRYACDGCPIGCGGHVQVKEGSYRTETAVHKVEYETMGLLGSNLLVDDAEALIRINDLCNRYGMDTIGCGGLIGYAIESFQKGLLTEKQTGGLKLAWGDPASVIALVEKIGKGEGIGAVLAKGFEEAVRVFGQATAPYAMAVRNEGLPAHDPRWHASLALTYYYDPTPARHCQGSLAFPLAGYTVEGVAPHQCTGLAKQHHENANLSHALNALGLCLFGYAMLDYKTLPDFLTAADGAAWSVEDLAQAGLRIAMARFLFNARAGLSPTGHGFPERALGQPPLQAGDTKGVQVDLSAMVREYQELLGVDPKTGLPPMKVLQELGLAGYLK
jgi:aldehyde:ferredoxin oxidoreductase